MMRNIRNLLVVIMLTSCYQLAFANYATLYNKNVPTCPTCYAPASDGFYVGAGLGYNNYRIRQSISNTLATGTILNTSPILSTSGFMEELLGGYGRYFDWFYIGGGAFFNYSQASNSLSINTYSSNTTLRYSLGASISPGFTITNLGLIYTRLGFVRSFFKYHEDGSAEGYVSRTAWANGLDVGIGIEAPIYQQISLRAEYNYAFYGKFESNIDTMFSPANSQFMVSIIYHFPECAY